MGAISDRLGDVEFELNQLTRGRKFMVIAKYDDTERNNLEIVNKNLDWNSAVKLAEELNLEEVASKVIICEHNKFMEW
jgi:hypothetical protein